jgi:hypothetical protein
MTAHDLAHKLLALPDHEVGIYHDEMQYVSGVAEPRVEWVDHDGEPPRPDWDDPNFDAPPSGPRGKFDRPRVVLRMD